MDKSSDKVLCLMQNTACSENITDDLPAHVALLRSLDYWQTHDFNKNDNMSFYFTQLILNPKYFSKTDLKIADALHISEKTVRNYRKDFKTCFMREYSLLKTFSDDELAHAYRSLLLILTRRIDGKGAADLSFRSRVQQYFSICDWIKAK